VFVAVQMFTQFSVLYYKFKTCVAADTIKVQVVLSLHTPGRYIGK